MQSKFWAKGVDDDSGDNASESSENEVDVREKKPLVSAAAERWAAMDSSSSEEEERVIKSQEGKKRDFYANMGKSLNAGIENNDFNKLLKDYESLYKFITKESEDLIPNSCIIYLDKLSKYVETTFHTNVENKNLTKSKAQALNKLRAKIRKCSEYYQNRLKAYHEDPKSFKADVKKENEDDYEEEDEDEEEEEEDEEEDEDEIINDSIDKKKKNKKKKKTESYDDSDNNSDDNSDNDGKNGKYKDDSSSDNDKKKDEEDDDNDEWSYSEDSDYESDEEDDKTKNAMSKWGLKTTESSEKKKTKKVVKTKKVKKEGTKKEEKSTFDLVDDKKSAKSKIYAELLNTKNISEEVIRNRIKLIIQKRGRKGLDKHENVNVLTKLCDIAKTISKESYIEVLEHLINLEFDLVSSVYTYMSFNVWNKTYKHIENILNLLIGNNNFYLAAINITEDITEEVLNEKEKCIKSCKTLISILSKLDDELLKALLYVDIHTSEYRRRLGKSVYMIGLLHKGYKYVKYQKKMPDLAIHISERILDHMYYKPEILFKQIWHFITYGKDYIDEDKKSSDLVKAKEDNTVVKNGEVKNGEAKNGEVKNGGVKNGKNNNLHINGNNEIEPPTKIIEQYVNEILEHGTKQQKIKSLLQLSYNKSLYDDFLGAKELLNVTNIYEIAVNSDISIQILYNRNLIQLGLCAFRHGNIYEAHCCLVDICAQNKHKELIAQGLSSLKNQDKTIEQERVEKRKLISYHMHISIELIECVNNICAMLLEVPNLAKNSFESKKDIISRQFRRFLDMYDKQIFNSPPENNKEIIISATKCLQKGDWQSCCEKIFSLSIWSKFNNKEKVQNILKEKIKQEAMKTYIFRYISIYDSFSVDQLCVMFDLDQNIVHSILSKMMINHEIPACWNECSKYIIINKINLTPLQTMALKLAENINEVMEQNELALNMKNP
ncbi:eukaryotic translation initiation factor 3 subunit C, putative, partial [Hepatocystis sp. ex Piliocolobus tephrosceles]